MTIVLGWLLQNAIIALVLTALVLVVCPLLKNRPAVQHALWLIVLVKLVTPPLVSWPWSLNELSTVIFTAAYSPVWNWPRGRFPGGTRCTGSFTGDCGNRPRWPAMRLRWEWSTTVASMPNCFSNCPRVSIQKPGRRRLSWESAPAPLRPLKGD